VKKKKKKLRFVTNYSKKKQLECFGCVLFIRLMSILNHR